MIGNLKNLFVATPSFKQLVTYEHRTMTLALYAACAASTDAFQHMKPGDRLLINRKPHFRLVNWHDRSRCSIAGSRNEFLHVSLVGLPVSETETVPVDWLLMVDADTSHIDPRPILEMIATGESKDAAVIGAPVLRRDGRYNMQREGVWDDRDPAKPDDIIAMVRQCQASGVDVYLSDDEFRGKVVPVSRMGAAFMALNCDWFRRHWGAWDPSDPWFHMRPTRGLRGEPSEIPEDYNLCDGVRKRGGKLLCDGRLEPLHEGAPYLPGHRYSIYGASAKQAERVGA